MIGNRRLDLRQEKGASCNKSCQNPLPCAITALPLHCKIKDNNNDKTSQGVPKKEKGLLTMMMTVISVMVLAVMIAEAINVNNKLELGK